MKLIPDAIFRAWAAEVGLVSDPRFQVHDHRFVCGRLCKLHFIVPVSSRALALVLVSLPLSACRLNYEQIALGAGQDAEGNTTTGATGGTSGGGGTGNTTGGGTSAGGGGGNTGGGGGTGGSAAGAGGCAPTNGGVEVCDGLDNDCTGGAD